MNDMAVWDMARRTGWSTRAVIAAVVLAVVLVAAVPVALFAGIIVMLFGHVIFGLALFGGSILAAGAAVVIAGVTGVWRVKQLVSRAQESLQVVRLDQDQDQGQGQGQDERSHPVVQLDHGDYHYS
jgi:uncharacterized membrane protein YdjX (TVP38/TMEM64 family)